MYLHLNDQSSAMSFVECRIETFQPYACVLAGELPVNLGLNPISVRLPCPNLAAHLVNGVNPAIETRTRHHTDFRFGHVQPAAVFRSVHKFELVPKHFGLRRLECLAKRTRTMGVQIVHHQRDGFGRLISLRTGSAARRLCRRPSAVQRL